MNEADLLQYQGALKEQRESIDLLRRSPYLDYPHEVSIETQTVCNATCSFCPYPTLERKGVKMPDALIQKIIGELGQIPVPFIVSPFKVNDPLLDVRLYDILAELNKLPSASIRLFTNGSPLTEKAIERIAAVQRVEHLWISLNHHKQDAYEKLMGLKFERTLANLDRLHAAKASGCFPHDVWVSRVRDHSADDDAFLEFVGNRYPLFARGIIYQSEWLGQVEGLHSLRRPPLVGCARWWELSITATGTVAFCCMDGKAEHSIGDVTKQTVLEIYNNPAYRVFRERYVTRLEAAPCFQCTHF